MAKFEIGDTVKIADVDSNDASTVGIEGVVTHMQSRTGRGRVLHFLDVEGRQWGGYLGRELELVRR